MNKTSGFTLIEVLVATIILLTVLSVAALSFTNIRKNVEQAEHVITMLSPVPFITDTIRSQIRQNPVEELHGDGSFQGVSFTWSAKSELFLPPPEGFVVESMTVVPYKPRYFLYDVVLDLTYRGKTRHFEYKEVGWLSTAVPE
jgi:prepilin-type N-terminal cleavage/methylation domain-containing protein